MALRFADADEFASRRHDVARIVSILAGEGVLVSAEAAYLAWQANSNSSCASWLTLDDEDELVSAQCSRRAREFDQLLDSPDLDVRALELELG